MKSVKSTSSPQRALSSRRSRPGRPKDASKRENIVRAASALFMKDGYELTSVDAVANKAGVSKLTIYSHFADKSELFKAVIQTRCTKLGTPESFAMLAQMPVEKALLQLSRNFVALVFSADSIRLNRIIQAEAVHHPHVVKIFYEAGPQRVKTAFSDLLCEFVKQGQLSISDVTCATGQFFSLLKGELFMKTLMRVAPAPDERAIREHVKATVAFFLAAYRPPLRV